jgi:hypothetical protein
MEIRNASPMQIRQLGIEALAQALGPVGMVRFLQQFETGSGDYTQSRDELLGDATIEDTLAQIKEQRHKMTLGD